MLLLIALCSSFELSAALECNSLLNFVTSRQTAEFVKAFKVFDKEDSGFIAVGEIKYILTQLGEKMEESEVEEVLKMAEVGA